MSPAGKKRKRAGRRRAGGEAAFKTELDRVIAAFTDRVVVSPRARRPPPVARPARSLAVGGLPAGVTLGEATRQFQFDVVRHALERHRRGGRWNIAATAKTLGVARSFLYRLIEEMEKAAPGTRGKTR